MRQKLFRWNRILHRDLGYLTVGLTLIFAVSGIALNHLDQWNPSYTIEHKVLSWSKFPPQWNKKNVDHFLDDLGVAKKQRSFYFASPTDLQIFLDEGSVTVDIKANKVIIERASPRPILKEWVLLHLNKSHFSWTILSDLYALTLLFLAIGGLFMIKGKKGFKWRGAIFALIGFVISIGFMFF